MEITEQQIKGLSVQSKIGTLRAIYARDFKLFLKNLAMSLDEHDHSGNPIKHFPDWPYIYDLADDLLKYKWLFVLKSRQVMATWVLCAYLLWTVLFHTGRKVACQSKKGDDAQSLIERMKVIYDHLPSWKPLAEFTYCRIRVPEMYSDCFGIPQGSDQIRSFTFSVIFSDEFAFQEELEDTFNASKPTVDGNGQFIAITTPPKKKNFAFKCLKNPVFQEPLGKITKIHYSKRPDRDSKWAMGAKKGYSSLSAWEREQELSFVESGVRRIYEPFNERTHVNPGLIYNPDKPLLVGIDFGFHRPAVTFSQISDEDRFLDLYEMLGQDIILEEFATKIMGVINIRFPNATINCYVDAAGNQVSDRNKKTSIEILRDIIKVYPVSRANLDIETGHELLRKKMVTLIKNEPAYQIHPCCQISIDAYIWGYIYGRDGATPHGDHEDDDGEREKDYFKHLMDAKRYVLQNIYTVQGTRLNTATKDNARINRTNSSVYNARRSW